MEDSINLTFEDVRDFLLAHNGKVKNAILVLHFKKYFNDPVTKNLNKERFKDIVNKLAAVKTENGEKFIVIKKKYRPDFKPLPSLDSVTSLDSQTSTLSMDSDPGREGSHSSVPVSREGSVSLPSSREGSVDVPASQEGSTSMPSSREGSECKLSSSRKGSADVQEFPKSNDDFATSREMSVESDKSTSSSAIYDPNAVQEPDITAEVAETTDAKSIFSVKDRAKVLNKMSEKPPEPKDYRMIGKIGKTQKMLAEEEKTTTVSLIDPVEHEWMIVAAKCDYMRMAKMLQEHSELARRKDFTNGYTGLHWACKHGHMDAIKLLAGTFLSPVNARSHGGYTPLHIAAMQGKDDVIDLLVKTYGADINIRDFGGKKPKQYLQNSASRHIQRNRRYACGGRSYSVNDVMDGSKRASRVTVEEVDAAIRRAGSEASYQGIGSFFNPQMSSLRASFRINKAAKNKENSQLSPTLLRRSSESPFSLSHVSEAYVSPVSEAYGSPVSEAYVSPVSEAYGSPVSEVYMSPVSEAYVSPVSEAYVSETRDDYSSDPENNDDTAMSKDLSSMDGADSKKSKKNKLDRPISEPPSLHKSESDSELQNKKGFIF